MSIQDTCCTIVPYFKVKEGEMKRFKDLCLRFIELTRTEEKCYFYAFTFSNDNVVHCREGYQDAEGVLNHLNNVGKLIEKALEIAELIQFEIHGPTKELEKLHDPLKDLNPKFFALEFGFRN